MCNNDQWVITVTLAHIHKLCELLTIGGKGADLINPHNGTLQMTCLFQ